MVEVDLGVALGLAGIGTALASAAYARTQAEATRRAVTVETDAAMWERVRDIRWKVATQPSLMREWVEANPRFAEALALEPSTFEAFVAMRDFLDASQDVYFLRRAGHVSDHAWRRWMTSLLPFARMPTFRRVAANARDRGAFEPAFVAFLGSVEAGAPEDPLGRVALTAASPAPGPSATPPP